MCQHGITMAHLGSSLRLWELRGGSRESNVSQVGPKSGSSSSKTIPTKVPQGPKLIANGLETVHPQMDQDMVTRFPKELRE